LSPAAGQYSALGIVMVACTLAGELDLDRYWSLPPHVQSLWIEHATNTITGRYQQPPKKAPTKTGSGSMGDVEGMAAIMRNRQRRG